MGNTSVKGHEVDDHGPTLVARQWTSYTGDSDSEGKVGAGKCIVLVQLT